MDPLVPLSYNFLSATPKYSTIIVIVILIMFSAFFSAVETALTCCNHVRLKLKAENGSKSAKLVLRILNHYDQSVISLLIGNNIVNNLASSLATVFALSLAFLTEATATLSSTIVITIAVFMFGEIIPKNIAKANSDKVAQILCYPLAVIYVITYPIMQIFNFILWIFKKIFRIKEDENVLTEDEFQDMIVNSEEEGILDEEESDIIQAAVDFNDITVKSVLTPKEKIVSLNLDKLSKNGILKNINDIKYTRIPVYKGNPDNIIGILNIRRFLKLAMSSKKFAVKQSMSEVLIVKDDTELNDVIDLFKTKKSHMAIVKANDGKLVGLVTMEDVLEELVGEVKTITKGGKK